jgi:hypothetical protein
MTRFDVLVLGGDAAGCVLAARLSEFCAGAARVPDEAALDRPADASVVRPARASADRARTLE